MAHTGAPPKAAKLGHSATADWTEVVDEPFLEGAKRELPKLPSRRRWNDHVVRWWENVRIMPHCALWTETDWMFAIETAIEKHEYYAADPDERKTTQATEIRRREDMLGVSLEARRKLRIRYVDPERARRQQTATGLRALPGGAAGETPPVSLNDRRNRLTG